MEYPLIIDGREQGKIRLSREGLYSVFEAELPGVQEGLYRLWLHGGGDCAYLGLMQPWSGGMYLRRKLSRREMETMPASIEYASNQKSLHNEKEHDKVAINIVESKDLSLHNRKENPAPACPWPAPVGEDAGELLWFRRADGSLVSHDGISSLIALPVRLRAKPEGVVLRVLEGREYMVFRY